MKKTPLYGLKCTHDDGSIGWLVNDDLTPATFKTVAEAEKEIKRRKKDKHCSWRFKLEAAEYKEDK